MWIKLLAPLWWTMLGCAAKALPVLHPDDKSFHIQLVDAFSSRYRHQIAKAHRFHFQRVLSVSFYLQKAKVRML
jgi:hypothetical protein